MVSQVSMKALDICLEFSTSTQVIKKNSLLKSDDSNLKQNSCLSVDSTHLRSSSFETP